MINKLFLRFDSVLRHLDAPDPTGELFGIKANRFEKWTYFKDKEMERAVWDGWTNEYFPWLLSSFQRWPLKLPYKYMYVI